MRLSDLNYVLTHVGGNWRDLSRCRDVPVEMVPDDGDAGSAVLAAKMTCVSCVVKADCLAYVTDNGPQYGIWGGLTMAERDRLRLARQPKAKPSERREVVKCEVCGLDCVPAIKAKQKCDSCLTPADKPGSAEAFKPQIQRMIEDGKTYDEIANSLGLSRYVVSKACRNWGTPSKAGRKAGTWRKDVVMLAPCGTPAGRRRHQRRGEEMTNCACTKPGSWRRDRTLKNGWVA